MLFDGSATRNPSYIQRMTVLGWGHFSSSAVTMPLITIKTGFESADGSEETLTEYLCDWPGCPNVAVHVLGCIRELRAMAVVCEEHMPPAKQPPTS